MARWAFRHSLEVPVIRTSHAGNRPSSVSKWVIDKLSI